MGKNLNIPNMWHLSTGGEQIGYLFGHAGQYRDSIRRKKIFQAKKNKGMEIEDNPNKTQDLNF